LHSFASLLTHGIRTPKSAYLTAINSQTKNQSKTSRRGPDHLCGKAQPSDTLDRLEALLRGASSWAGPVRWRSSAQARGEATRVIARSDPGRAPPDMDELGAIERRLGAIERRLGARSSKRDPSLRGRRGSLGANHPLRVGRPTKTPGSGGAASYPGEAMFSIAGHARGRRASGVWRERSFVLFFLLLFPIGSGCDRELPGL
jgi:hypothetical protein